MRATCAVADCGKPVHGHGFCSSHWNRWRRYGDPLGSKPRPIGRRVAANRLDHPLAGRSGKIRRARLVLYAKLEGQPSSCHWCDRSLAWCTEDDARRRPDALCADHLDVAPAASGHEIRRIIVRRVLGNRRGREWRHPNGR